MRSTRPIPALDVLARVLEARPGALELASAEVPRLAESSQARNARIERVRQRVAAGGAWRVARIAVVLAILIGVMAITSKMSHEARSALAGGIVVLCAIAIVWSVFAREPTRRRNRRDLAAARRSRQRLAIRALRDPAGTQIHLELARAEALERLEKPLTMKQTAAIDAISDQGLSWGLMMAVIASAYGLAMRVGMGNLGPLIMFAAMVLLLVLRGRSHRRWIERVRRGVRGAACADCGYAIAGTPCDPRAPYLGPRRCPECGSRWPCVPPEIPAAAKY